MSLDVASSGPPLVLLVDSNTLSRHWMWRALSRTFGVIEAGDARGARAWLTHRPDIDALIVDDDLPDERGIDLVRDLASADNRAASRAIVLARPSPDWARHARPDAALVARGDLLALVAKLSGWFLARDAGLARALRREAERLST
jgi:response regulator RpfG family c-di-GMP phosphodiesterase